MAAPSEITIKNLNGSFTMNKQLSDPTEPILALQGVGWIIRKAIGVMTVILQIKEYEEGGVYHVDIVQPGAAGIKGTSEERILDGAKRDHEDHVFGAVVGTSEWKKVSDYSDSNEEEKFLKSGWLEEETDGKEVIESYVESVKNGWTAKQVWGFQTINGERRYARNVVVKKGDKTIHAKLYYDYQGQV